VSLGLTIHSTTSRPTVTTVTATAHPPRPAAHILAPRPPHLTNQVVRLANTAHSRATTVTLRHRLASTAAHHNIKPREATARVNSNSSTPEAMAHRLASADTVDKVDKATEARLQAATDSRLAMAGQHRATMVDRATTTTTSTTRYALDEI
jgi:hypothetical protein